MYFLCRYGGDEFVMLLPFTAAEDAAVLCERLRQGIEEEVFEFLGNWIPVTVSVGVFSQMGKAVRSLEDMLGHADKALFEAKHGGRNRVAYLPRLGA